jgi:ribosomal protein S18 acetylase RimI-like enzyme
MKHLRAEKISPEKADAVHDILSACGKELAARHGFRNWDPPASILLIRKDTVDREVYLFYQGTEAVATITLGMSPSAPYGDDLPWSFAISSAVHVNRLGVHPLVQGLGYGTSCMRFAENRATALGARAVCCDVLAANNMLRNFYQGLGYRYMGERDHSGWHFACYEKVL